MPLERDGERDRVSLAIHDVEMGGFLTLVFRQVGVGERFEGHSFFPAARTPLTLLDILATSGIRIGFL